MKKLFGIVYGYLNELKNTLPEQHKAFSGYFYRENLLYTYSIARRHIVHLFILKVKLPKTDKLRVFLAHDYSPFIYSLASLPILLT